MTMGERTIGSPRSRIAATMLAAISKAPFSRCFHNGKKIKRKSNRTAHFYALFSMVLVACPVPGGATAARCAMPVLSDHF